MSVEKLRRRLDQVDRQILELIAQRQAIVSEIGSRKHASGRAVRDFARERQVIEQGVDRAEALGMSGDIARDILERLIYHSLSNQEQRRLASARQGHGKSALVIGGLGRMGGWIARFLDAQGYAVQIADPASGRSLFENIGDFRTRDLDHDIVAVAAPLRASNDILLTLARLRPAGLIFDIGSLKSPLKAGLNALREAGCAVTSVHPMFGPEVMMLSGRHVLVADAGVPAANRQARALFAETMADCIDVSVDEHDQTMAWVLGLSHMLNLAFAATLASSDAAVSLLKRVSSTTFNDQLRIASGVVAENPHLYFEIQRLNEAGMQPLHQYAGVMQDLIAAIRDGDEAAFVERMQKADRRLNGGGER